MGEFIFTFENNGPTIPKKEMKKNFMPGFTTKIASGSNSGPGLAIVNRIVFVEQEKDVRQKSNVYLIDGRIEETSSELKEIREMCSDDFVPTHRSYLIHLKYVSSIEPDGASREIISSIYVTLTIRFL